MRFYLLSLGCPKNTVDAEGMAHLLRTAGHTPVMEPQDADVLIVNTCGFIAPAKEESLAVLQELAASKRPGQWLIAAGCLSQRYGQTLARQVPGLDGILGTRRWWEIGPLLEHLARQRPRRSAPVWTDEPRTAPPSTAARVAIQGPSAYLKIADGCSAPCAFCAIPLIKGPARSRPMEAILADARLLAQHGVQEVILIAQDTTAYGRDRGEQDGLARLLEALIAAAPQIRWWRLMYAYPQHITPRLIEVMATHPQVCHYLDLPLQHAHPDVLRRMRRPHNVERIRRLIADLRMAMPDIALRTAFIVGYPGETEEEFQTLLDFVQEIRFDKVGVFTYSREEGTAAADLPDQLPEEIKEERYHRLMELQQGISLASNQAQVGRTLEILVEGYGDGLSLGRSYRDAPEIDGLVIVQARLPVGKMLPVRITGALPYDLVGERVTIQPQRAQRTPRK